MIGWFTTWGEIVQKNRPIPIRVDPNHEFFLQNSNFDIRQRKSTDESKLCCQVAIRRIRFSSSPSAPQIHNYSSHLWRVKDPDPDVTPWPDETSSSPPPKKKKKEAENAENRVKSACRGMQGCRGRRRGWGREGWRESGREERTQRELGTVICKEAGVCFGRWQQSAAVRDNPPVIKTINPSAD